MQFLENLWITLTSNYVGQDKYGNKYYIAKFQDPEGGYRRRIIYRGIPEPTKIPVAWYSWLHQHTNELPQTLGKHPERIPNFTGTDKAYKCHPPKTCKNENFEQRVAWVPKEEK